MQYPITRLIMNTLETKSVVVAKQRLSSLLTSIRTNKALRIAEYALYEGSIKSDYIEHFADALQLTSFEIEAALEETRQLKLSAKRARYFKELGPHLLVETDGPRSSITIAALTYKQLIIVEVEPSIINMSLDEQFEHVSLIIKKHFKKCKGSLPVFGSVKGYLYCSNIDSHYRFDNQGNQLSGNLGPVPLIQSSISVGGKEWAL